LSFLDALINNKDPSKLITSVYHKKTFTGLLTNFFSFTSFSYKLGLIRTLLDRAYKINSTRLGFNEEVKIPRSFHFNIVHKFACAECNSAYVGEMSRHLSTIVREHLSTDKNSNSFEQLRSSDKCKRASNDSCFTILDSAKLTITLKLNRLHKLCGKAYFI